MEGDAGTAGFVTNRVSSWAPGPSGQGTASPRSGSEDEKLRLSVRTDEPAPGVRTLVCGECFHRPPSRRWGKKRRGSACPGRSRSGTVAARPGPPSWKSGCRGLAAATTPSALRKVQGCLDLGKRRATWQGFPGSVPTSFRGRLQERLDPSPHCAHRCPALPGAEGGGHPSYFLWPLPRRQ